MLRSATILVVDDEADVRDVAVGYLTALGYSALSASDGEEALAILESAQPVDLLLTDIVMPGKLDGISLSRRAVALRPSLKVLHVTGYGRHLGVAQGNIGCGAALAKPYRREELQLRLAWLLGTWTVERNPRLRRLHHYWRDQRQDRPLPDRRDIDPADLKEILPNLAIIEVMQALGGLRFRYRLFGTALADAYGINPTGKFVDDVLSGAPGDFILGLLREVATTAGGIYAASTFRLEETRLSIERLFLPLTVGGDAVGQILLGQTLDWSARKTVALTMVEQAADRTDAIERLT